MRDFLIGISYLPRAFRLLWAPQLRRFVLAPILVNVLVFALLFAFGGHLFGDLLNWLLPDPERFAGGEWWAQLLRALVLAVHWLLWPLFVIAAAVLMFYTFTLVANLIGSPFNGPLAARVEQLASGHPPPESQLSLLQEAAASIGSELRKYGYFLKLMVPLGLLLLIPVANMAAAPLWALFGAWALALEYLDYPMGNRGLRFPQVREQLRRRRALALGFGFGMMAMTLIPGLNLLAMPTGVIGGTLLWVREWRQEGERGR